MERETTIGDLFGKDRIQFMIPTYQRAFSWEKEKQVNQFILDLREQPPEKEYFLGHFLFETDSSKSLKYQVIDGQQRLTTVVIFVACLIHTLEERLQQGEVLVDSTGEAIELWRIREQYLEIKNSRKFLTVPYDDTFFEGLVFRKNMSGVANTTSKKRIRDAWDYICELMEKETSSNLMRWKSLVDGAVITTFEVTDKVRASQIFAFQNDRGKDLSNLEKLKAYLMYQVYLKSAPENAADAIRYVESEFSDIYRHTERVNLSEDQILSHYSTAFLAGWENPLENIKKELLRAVEKDTWIKNFSTNLKNVYINAEVIEQSIDKSCVGDILVLDPHNSWPLLLKVYHYHNTPKVIEKCERIFKLMEIALFKKEYTVGDYRTNSFHAYAKEYTGNFGQLLKELTHCAGYGFKEYWAFDKDFERRLRGAHHYSPSTRYLLWKWENHLRGEAKVSPMRATEYLNKYGKKNLDSTIEHIAPENPEGCTYSDVFKEESLHNLGNLVLMTLGKNAQLNNDPPFCKAERMRESTLISQKLVGDAILEKGKWEQDEIQNRHGDIVRFALGYWKV